jgi:hypothetical protein
VLHAQCLPRPGGRIVNLPDEALGALSR